MKILSVVGTRPNFIKVLPICNAIQNYNIRNTERIDHIIVHTGQHYDKMMSEVFFKELELQEPEYNLGIGSGSHAFQTGNTMIELEKVFIVENPDWIIVYGDVNATLAAAITARKLGIKCCHVESGLRSDDLTMPEEINRVLVDRISDLLLIPDLESLKNLEKEGICGSKVVHVGNIMIDSLLMNLEKARLLDLMSIVGLKVNCSNDAEGALSKISEPIMLVTLHRPANVDDLETLSSVVRLLVSDFDFEGSIIWPVHPRTRKNLSDFGLLSLLEASKRIVLIKPVSYLEMLCLTDKAAVVITDSGGLQVEASYLGKPTLVFRTTTEWKSVLVENGGNATLVNSDIKLLKSSLRTIKELGSPSHATQRTPVFWEGETAARCVEAIIRFA